MLSISCPKCEKQVTLPPAARAESRVRCPLCSEEYTLECVFADLPPLLELLDAPSANGSPAAEETAEKTEEQADEHAGEAVDESSESSKRGMFDFGEAAPGAQTLDGDDLAVADAEDVAPKTSSFDFGDDSTPQAAGVAGGKTAMRTTARPAKKKASPMKSIIGIVIGGLVAAPIAQMILWWLPGGWAREQHDPLNLAPKLPGFVAFLAPASLRNADEAPINEGSEGQPSEQPRSSRPPENNVNNVDDVDSSFGRSGLNEALQGGNGVSGNGGSGSDDKPPRAGNRQNGRDGNQQNHRPPRNRPPRNEPPEGGDEPQDDTSPQPQVGVKDAPSYTPSDLAAELKKARDRLRLIDDAADKDVPGDVRIARGNEFVNVVAELAHVITFTSDRPAGHLEHVDEILFESGSSKIKRDIIGTLAEKRFNQPDREGDGILLLGSVKEIRPAGQLFETIVNVNCRSQMPISIYGEKNPEKTGAFSPGEMVIVLGVIVDEPNKSLTGYKGPPDPVIWGGYSQVIEAKTEN